MQRLHNDRTERRLCLLSEKHSGFMLLTYWLNDVDELGSVLDPSPRRVDGIPRGNVSDFASKFFTVINCLGHAPRGSRVANPIDRDRMFGQ